MTEQILTGKICPYCGSVTEYVDSAIVYGKSYGMIYICKPCDAYVGVHKGTDNALGRLANAELRHWKKEAHAHFDPIAKTDLINRIWPEFIPDTSNRTKAYIWLSGKMEIDVKYCHIGMFDIDQCKKVVEICNKYKS